MSLPARRTRDEELAVMRINSGCCSRPTAPASVRAGPSRCPRVSLPRVIPYPKCPETARNTGACASHIAAAPFDADLLKQTSGTPDFAREPSDGLRGIRHRTSEETRLLHTGLGLRVGLTPGEVGRGSRGRGKRRVGRMDTHRRGPFACEAAGTHRTHVRVPDPLRSASQDKPSGFVTPQPLLAQRLSTCRTGYGYIVITQKVDVKPRLFSGTATARGCRTAAPAMIARGTVPHGSYWSATEPVPTKPKVSRPPVAPLQTRHV